MIWYAMMFNKDRDNTFESERNMTEYLASFINGDAVRQTRDAREKQKVIPDQDFEQILREQFGRDLSPEALANATRAEADERPVVVEQKKKGSISIEDIKKYTGLDMDEVKFIPKRDK